MTVRELESKISQCRGGCVQTASGLTLVSVTPEQASISPSILHEKIPFREIDGATFTSDPTRNACSTFRKVMGLLGTTQLGTPSPRHPSLQHDPGQVYTTAMSRGETGIFRPGTLEQQAGFSCTFSTFLMPKSRGVPLRS